MNLLRFVAALLLLSVFAFGQAVDYRALGTNSYYTNGLRVNDKHWTNSAGLYRYQPLTGTVAAGQPGPPLVLRSDGSAFVGTNVFQDVAPTAAGIFFPYVISMTDSNEPTTVHGDWWAIDSENYGVYAGAALTVQQAGLSTFVLSGDTGPQIRVTSVRGGPGFDAINVSSNTVDGFRVSEGGDLTLINALAYTWPTARGPAGSVLTDAAANGTLTWASAGGGTASIGPGTNNYYAKFDSTGTNVVNSPTKSAFTNSIEHFLLPNTTGTITFTNGATTNRMYAMWAHANTNSYLEFVSPPPFSSQWAHIRAQTTGFTSQRPGILLNDSVAVEPVDNPLGGHAAGSLYPIVSGLGTLGTPVLLWHGVYSDTNGFAAQARNDQVLFSDGAAKGFGISTAGALYLTGPAFVGIQFNQDKVTGSPQFDLGASQLGFGSTISNSIAQLQESTLVGYVQVGTNNANTATARAQGIIAARASGTDRPGSDLLLAAGMGTGNALTPKIRFQSSNPGSTGSGLNNTLIDRMVIDTNTVTIYSNFVVNGTISGGGGGGVLNNAMLMTTNNAAAAGRVFFTTNGTAYLGTNFTGAFVNGGIYGTNVFAIDVPGAVSALIVKTNGGVQSSTVIGVGAVASSTASSIQMSPGGGSQGYLEFWHGTTRRGYMGFGTTTLPLTLENGASFVVTGGNQTNTGSIASGVAYMLPTNYVAANFTPVAGMVKIVSSNGVLWKVTQLTTNLLSQDIP